MPVVETSGGAIHYEDSSGDGPAIIFSHGLLMDREMFAPQVAALRGEYRCLAWDERGHGLTAGDALAPFSYYDSADDLVAILKHAGISRAVLVGMSQGGYLSLRCALRHPEIVRALILIDTQATLEDPAKTPGYQRMVDDWAQNGLSEKVAGIVAHIILGDWAGTPAWQAKWRAMTPANLVGVFTTLVTRDEISEDIKRIDVPALVIHGADDIAIELSRAEAMRRALPGARDMVVVPGAGHAANLTHPEPVNAAIRRFLRELPA